MAIHELKEQIARLPEQPGVYLYFNADGDTIYVGKARALRDRVRNYLAALTEAIPRRMRCSTRSPPRGYRHRLRGRALLSKTISSSSALQHNILLRDDKNYPYLQLTTNEAFQECSSPQGRAGWQLLCRTVSSGHAARKTMALTHRLFGIRSCNEVIRAARRPFSNTTSNGAWPRVETVCSRRGVWACRQADRAVSCGRNTS